MTAFEIFTVIGILGGIVLGAFNWYNGKRTVDQIAATGDTMNIKTQNEAIQLANDRAYAAEKRADALEKRLTVLEAKMSYKLTFDVLLGTDPSVEHVTIEHYLGSKLTKKSYTGIDRRAGE